MYKVYFEYNNDLHVAEREHLKDVKWDLMVHRDLYGRHAWATRVLNDELEEVVTFSQNQTVPRSSEPTVKVKQATAFTTA